MKRVKRNSCLLEATLQAEGMPKSALTPPTLFPRQLLRQGKAQRDPRFPLSQAVLLPKKQANLPTPCPAQVLAGSGPAPQSLSLFVIVAASPSGITWIAAGLCIPLCRGVSGLKGAHYRGFSFLYRACHTEPKHTHFFLFCFLTCHCLSYSKAFLTAAFFVQVLSHIDFPSPKLWIKERGTKGKMVFFFFLQREENCFVFMIPRRPTLISCQNNMREKKNLYSEWFCMD